jgi:hypothetical protein
MKYYVYCYFDVERDEPIYVGYGHDRRAYDHLKRKDRHPFVQRVQKMLAINNVPKIVFIGENLDATDAVKLEIDTIKKFGRKDKGLGSLLNLTDGGEGTTGLVHSHESKQKMSENRKGIPWTEEARQKIMEGRSKSSKRPIRVKEDKLPKQKTFLRNKKLSDQQCESISTRLRGKPKSDECKKKLSSIIRSTEFKRKLSLSRQTIFAIKAGRASAWPKEINETE